MKIVVFKSQKKNNTVIIFKAVVIGTRKRRELYDFTKYEIMELKALKNHNTQYENVTYWIYRKPELNVR